MKTSRSCFTLVSMLVFVTACGGDDNPTNGGDSDTTDKTPPTLAASNPVNGTVNVPVGTNVAMTFSEAVDPTSFESVFITPEIASGIPVWSDDGRTVTFDPDSDLMADTQYKLIIVPGGVRDLAGNGNTWPIEIIWSTGSMFESGGIRGTIAGDDESATASDPTGATVIAATSNPFGPDDDFGIAGSATVEADGSYAITNLRDGWYFPLAVLDSNGDGEIDPSTGDAIGLFGIDFQNDLEVDSVQIVNGQTMVEIDFGLYDPVAMLGTVSYAGTVIGQYVYYVLAFDVSGFDANNLPEPDYSSDGDIWPNNPDYVLDELDNGLQPGTYFVGAYLDVNANQQFDDGIDPLGFYGGSRTSPVAVTLPHGQDAFDIDITITDTTPRNPAPTVTWSQRSRGEPTTDPRMRSAVRRIQRALERQR